MNIEQLNYFIEVAQTLNFSEAAKRSYISQPAISNSISKLEKQLGAQLFYRSTHGVRLTEAGRELLPYAIQTVSGMRAARARILNAQRRHSGSISISVLPSANNILLECLRALMAQYPDIFADIKMVDGLQQIEALDNDECDFCFAMFKTPPSSRNSDLLLAKESNLVLIAPKGRWSGLQIDNLSMFSEEPFITISPVKGPAFYDQTMEVCKNRSLIPRVVSYNDNATSILISVSAGVGFSILPAPLLDTTCVEGIDMFPLPGDDTRYDVYIAWKRNNTNMAAQRFLDVVSELYPYKQVDR